MTSANKTWEKLKAQYLRAVEKTLSQIDHPRRNEVLDDVRSHLDRRFAELGPNEQTWENFQVIITNMGPPSDYAELLDTNQPHSPKQTTPKSVLAIILAAIVITAVMILLPILLLKEPKPVTPDEFSRDFAQKITQFDIDNADLNKVIDTFGQPLDYIWGQQTLDRKNLPSRYAVVYPCGFQVFISQGKVVEIRFEHEQPEDYLFLGKLRVGSSLDEVIEAIGRPFETVEGRQIGWVGNVLYKDINGRKGHCYYHRPDKNVRIFFVDYKVAALYITRSDYDTSVGGKVLEKTDLPSTSIIDVNGRIVDKIDYPFINDPEAIGHWKSVDFVSNIEDFIPEKKNWQGDLFLKELFLLENGKTNWAFTWTKGLILHGGDKTASKYLIKEINGLTYMFLEWKSGDYKIRHIKPKYYVLKKVSDKDTVTLQTEQQKEEQVVEVAGASNTQGNSREHSETNTIVPGQRVGDYKLGMSKDDVLKSLGKPKAIFHGEEKYTLDNPPKTYFMRFDDISFEIVDDSVQAIVVHSPFYKFANGLGVGDSEKEFKQAFGFQFTFEEDQGKLYLTYKDEGLQFIIHKKKRTVMEFTVTKKTSHEPRASLAKPIESVKPYDDIRWKDLSKLDLSTRKRLIATLTFNKKTVWPEQAKMPPGSDPNKILTDALNPGLGVRKLHQQGITGKGVNVAIIDQPTYLVHHEFAGKIVAYHDTGCETDESSMHGPLVASLLVGTNCGTAPGARVYYAAAPSWKTDAAYYAKGLDWIIAQNKKLPEGEKIRVVSVSASPNQSSWANRQMWDRACDRAEADGIMVLDCTDSRRRGFIGRCWYNARVPESAAQCNPWAPPNREFRFNPADFSILVPSSPRTAAEDGAVPGYQYAGRGGLSRAIPYCAGVLAMGWQVNPELSPEQMRELLYKSAYTKKNGAKIIYPKKFILLVKRTAPRKK